MAVGISGQRGDDLAVVVGLAIHIDGQLIAADDVHGHAGQRRTGIGFVQASVGVQLIDLHTTVDFDILLGVFVAAVQPPDAAISILSDIHKYHAIAVRDGLSRGIIQIRPVQSIANRGKGFLHCDRTDGQYRQTADCIEFISGNFKFVAQHRPISRL